MRSTGLFTVKNYVIDIKEIGEPIYLLPFSDVHKFAPLHADEKWKEFLEWARGKKRAYFIGLGDYVDLASTSERNSIKTGKFHDSTIMTLEELYIKHINELYKDIEFMQGRLVGLMDGNHFAEFRDGTNSTQQLCRLMKCNYLGVSTFIRLKFRWKNHGANIDVWAHHGMGASRFMGTSLKRVEDMEAQADADIYLMSHDHKKSVGFKSKLCLSEARGNVSLKHQKQLFARCGSFLRGYVPDEVSYVADANMNPTDMGVVKIELTPQRKEHESLSIDIHASI